MAARFCMLLALCAVASGFVALPAAKLPVRAARSATVTAQFGTGNTDNNGFDMDGNANWPISPITGGSKEYPYGEYDLDQSGELPAKLLALLATVGLPVAFAVSIFSIP